MTPAPAVRIDRLADADLMQWQADVGSVPHHIGGLLLLDTADRPRPAALVATLTERLGRLPLLRRRPIAPPVGGGGWYWLEDDVDPASHVTARTVGPGGTDALLDAAIESLTTPARPGRSPWTATVLVTPDGVAAGVVLVLHHVLADGVGGLAVLGALVDGSARAQDGAPREPVTAADRPRYAALVADAWVRRLRALTAPGSIPGAVRALRAGRSELGHGARAPRTRLNRPTGPRRRLQLVEVDEAAVRAAARRLGASVNDLVLVAAVESLRAAAADAGEELDSLTVSVPVAMPADQATGSGSGSDSDSDSGSGSGSGSGARNAVGVLQLAVPATGRLSDRVGVVTGRREQRLAGDHGRSLPLVLLAFRILRTVHLVGWFLDRQRLVNTLVTAVPAIPGTVRVNGTTVVTLVPLVPNQGNTTAAFATARYAGRLVVAVTTDPDVGPDGAVVAERLRTALAMLAPRSPTS